MNDPSDLLKIQNLGLTPKPAVVIDPPMVTETAAQLAPSAHQAAVLSWVRTGRGHATVEAVAGSGKSTLLRMACEQTAASVGMFAFNNEAKNALVAKVAGLAHVTVSTIHSLGNGAIPRHQVNADKYRTAIRPFQADWRKGKLFGAKLSTKVREALDETDPYLPILKLCDLARLDLLSAPSDAELCALLDHHSIDLPAELFDLAFKITRTLIAEQTLVISSIDFVDMLYLPHVHGFAPRQFSFVFVDECQDLNKAQLVLVKRAVKPGGRMLFVGDRRQAIYGFAGADAESFNEIAKGCETILPLSVCYRCPKTVIARAQTLCPQIEAAETAPEGTVRDATADEALAQIVDGDMILCRVNAPLLGLCYQLIAAGIPAAVRGRDISTGLAKTIDAAEKLLTVEQRDNFAQNFGAALSDYTELECAKATRKGGTESQIDNRHEQINDRAECVRAVFGSMARCDDSDALKSAIATLFANNRPAVQLSSVHRAKGLEAKRVFILRPELLENPRAKTEWQLEQERNLNYVAVTRALSELVFIR